MKLESLEDLETASYQDMFTGLPNFSICPYILNQEMMVAKME